MLSYTDKEDGAQNIKVEINKRDFNCAYEIKQYLGLSIKVMVQADMVANKLVAMHERIGHANRDIYDVWFFLSNHWPVNRSIVKLRTNMQYSDFLKACILDLESSNNRTILAGMGELLSSKQKAWVKAHLIEETIFLLRLALKNELKT